MSADPVTVAFGLSKLTNDQRWNVFLTIVEHGGKRVPAAAFQQLRRADVADPKRVFKATLRYLCKKTMLATRTSKDGEVHATTPPPHSTMSTIVNADGDEVDGYTWTKWVVRGEDNMADVVESGALEIVMPAPRNEAEAADTKTIMDVLKGVVVKTLTFAARPTLSNPPPVPIVFASAAWGVPVRTSVVEGSDSRVVDMWYTEVAGGGYMIAGSGRDGMSAARRVKQRLLVEMSPNSGDVKKTKEKSAHQRYQAQYRARQMSQMANSTSNFDAALAASART